MEKQVKTTVELKDSKKELRRVVKPAIKYFCKDGLWVQCPYDALVNEMYCEKPDIPCPHRGGVETAFQEDYEVVDVSMSRQRMEEEEERTEDQ